MKKLPWSVYEAEKDGVTMLVIMKSGKGSFLPNTSLLANGKPAARRALKQWNLYLYKYFIPISMNSEVIRTMLRVDYGAKFRPKKYKHGDNCWYCDVWIEELREFAEAVNGNIPVFNSEES